MEETFQQAHSVLTSGYALIAMLLGSLALLGKMLTTLIKAVGVHEKYFFDKRVSRLRFLREGVQTNQDLIKYLDNAIELESFRVASGLSTSAANMTILIQLSNRGRWSRSQIKTLARFLMTPQGSTTPEICITKLDKVGAGLGLVSGFFLLLLGLFYFLWLTYSGVNFGLLLGVLVYGAFIVAARLFLTDFINYLVAKRALAYLELHPLQTEATAN